MTIPIDRLYHFIENILRELHGVTVIYRFWPHGSKNLANLQPLHKVDWVTRMTAPPVVCHDQEPLNFDFYQNHPVLDDPWTQLQAKYRCQEVNLRQVNIFDQTILLHSEQRSQQVVQYQNHGFVPVYYWSHAIIAMDWFRFANHVNQNKNIKKTFLIYNRAWTGSREYRLKFAELLHLNQLAGHCKTTLNCIDPDHQVHYQDHNFENKIWKPGVSLDNAFDVNTTPSSSSGDFHMPDYEVTEIEVVLETLFDDSRLHLTEKTLRPIACGQPFILASTVGSLSYLRQYGFKTYDSVWDETYDTISDPLERLQAIVALMHEIAKWPAHTRLKKFQQAQTIAMYNKQRFFSKEFFDLIKSELTSNLNLALQQQINHNASTVFLERRKKQCLYDELKNVLTGKAPHPCGDILTPSDPGRETTLCARGIVQVLQQARHYYNSKNT
jgi:hypothetical protein